VLVDADQAVELGADARRLRDLDEQRGRELALAGHQLVVDVELVLDARRIADLLDAQHLLYLEAQRLAVLEEQRHLLADCEAPTLLVGDQRAPVVVAHLGVGLEPGDLLAAQRLHGPPSP
jgi:hypothetical protein